MALSFQGRTTFVRQFIAAVKAAANAVVDSATGSVTLALGEAVTGVALWLQALLANVLLLTRAATSTGADLDSFYADWFFTRLPATAANGFVTFARATATQQAVVPVGQLVSTGPGGAQYIVTQDSSNSAWNGGLQGYLLPPATTSVTVPISAVSAGSAGNVIANTITSFVSPIPGVDTVTNASPITNGLDAEADAPFRARFQLYIQGLRQGTVIAFKSAIANLQQGLTCVVLENTATDLTADKGMVTVVVDDGTGAPSSTLLTLASAAIDAARAAGIRFGVIAPAITNVTITLTVASQDTTKHAADTVAAAAAVSAYVNTLPIGASLVWARIYQVAFDAAANIVGVSAIQINGATADIAVTAKGIVKTNSVTVS